MMPSVTILRALWRRRAAVVIVALVALAGGGMLAFHPSFPPKSRGYDVGVASINILVDTPKSQVIEVAPKGSDTLADRANVLANLMVDGDVKNAIARRAGLPAKKLIGYVPSPDGSTPPPPLTARSLEYSTSVVMTSDMAELPIIKVQTQAPDVVQAIHLANAVATGLGDYLDAKASSETVADTSRLRVRALGTAQGEDSQRGPSRAMALVAAFVIFLVGCGGIVGLPALISVWRAAADAEVGGYDDELRFDTLDGDGDPIAPEPGVAPALHALPNDDAFVSRA
jgi:hypothetical protein